MSKHCSTASTSSLNKSQIWVRQITNLQRQQQPPSSTSAPNTITSTINGTKDGTSWAAAIGYFYPNMPMSWGTGDVIDREDTVYCRGVYRFTDRLKIATQSRNVNFVKNLSQNMETCFRGETLRWWNDELRHTHKARPSPLSGVSKFGKGLSHAREAKRRVKGRIDRRDRQRGPHEKILVISMKEGIFSEV